MFISLVSAAISSVRFALTYFGASEWVSLVGFLIFFVTYVQIQTHIWLVVKAVRKADALQRCLRLRRLQCKLAAKQ